MQAVNATATGSRGDLAAGGTRGSQASSLKADFAAMLSDIGDAALGDGTLSGIFGAMKELKEKNASLASDISCKRRDLKDGNDQVMQNDDEAGKSVNTDAKVKTEEPRNGNEAEENRDAADAEENAAPKQDQVVTATAPATESISEVGEESCRMEGEVENWLGALMQPESETLVTEENAAVQANVISAAAEIPEDALAGDALYKSQDPARVLQLQMQSQPQAATACLKTQDAASLNVNDNVSQDLTQSLQDLGGQTPDAVTADPVSQMISEEISDSGLSVMMAKAGVIKVSLTQSGTDDVASLSEGISADLEVIDDALQAAAALSRDPADADGGSDQNSKWFSQGESAYRSESGAVKSVSNSAAQNQSQSVTEALAALRVSGGMEADEAVRNAANSKNVAAALGNSAGEVAGLEEAGASKSSALEGTSSSVLPDTGTISKSREMGRANQAQDLRAQMLTLSRDARKNAEEITKAVMTMAARNLKTLSFELNPQGLGRMEISIDSDAAEDAVKVNLAAENGATRQLLSQGLNELKDSLHRAGLAADAEMGEFSGNDAREHPQGQGGQGQGFDGTNSRTLFAGVPENDEASSATAQESDDDTLSLYA